MFITRTENLNWNSVKFVLGKKKNTISGGKTKNTISGGKQRIPSQKENKEYRLRMDTRNTISGEKQRIPPQEKND